MNTTNERTPMTSPEPTDEPTIALQLSIDELGAIQQALHLAGEEFPSTSRFDDLYHKLWEVVGELPWWENPVPWWEKDMDPAEWIHF